LAAARIELEALSNVGMAKSFRQGDDLVVGFATPTMSSPDVVPGTPSITEFAAAAQKANKNLFDRGCVTTPDAAGNFYYDLKGTSPPQ
jgi:hypothetical protein